MGYCLGRSNHLLGMGIIWLSGSWLSNGWLSGNSLSNGFLSRSFSRNVLGVSVLIIVLPGRILLSGGLKFSKSAYVATRSGRARRFLTTKN